MAYALRFTRQAEKDMATLTPKLRQKLKEILLHVVAVNPHEGKKLLGDLAGSYSLRLNLKDRIVYSIDEERQVVYVERARTHYGN